MPTECFSITLPRRVIAGTDCLKILPQLTGEFSALRPLAVTDEALCDSAVFVEVLELLAGSGSTPQVLVIPTGEPADTTIYALRKELTGTDCDLMVGFGGGSVLDCVKLLAVLPDNPGLAENLFEISALQCRRIHTVMIPTTAGTGAEATPNAVIRSSATGVKTGIVHPLLVADAVLLDPTATASMPAALSAATGFDALAHAIECQTSKKASPFSALFAFQAIPLIFENLETACTEPSDAKARLSMQLASYYAGACIAASSTHFVHAMAYPLSGRYHMPHGLSIAILLPEVLRRMEEKDSHIFSELCLLLRLPEGKRLSDSVTELAGRCGLPRSLVHYGARTEDAPALAAEAAEVRRLFEQGPIPFRAADCETVYRSLTEKGL